MKEIHSKLLVCCLVLLAAISGTVKGDARVPLQANTQAYQPFDTTKVPWVDQKIRAECAGGKDRLLPPPSQVVVDRRKPRNPACLVSVDSVSDQIAKQQALLIDVRDTADFEKFRIAGSLNIPLHAIKAKAFLKNKTFIMTNEGRSTTELELFCADLRRSGYSKASVLRGGLNAWKDQNGFLDGDATAQKKLNRLLPAEYMQENASNDWMVFDLSGYNKKEVQKFFPNAVEIGVTKSGGKAGTLMSAAIIKKIKSRPGVKVLIFDVNGNNYEKMESVLKGIKQSEVLYLEGGFIGYQKYVHQQIAMQQHLLHPPKRKGCSAS